MMRRATARNDSKQLKAFDNHFNFEDMEFKNPDLAFMKVLRSNNIPSKN